MYIQQQFIYSQYRLSSFVAFQRCKRKPLFRHETLLPSSVPLANRRVEVELIDEIHIYSSITHQHDVHTTAKSIIICYNLPERRKLLEAIAIMTQIILHCRLSFRCDISHKRSLHSVNILYSMRLWNVMYSM